MRKPQQYVDYGRGSHCASCGKPYSQHFGTDPDAFCYRPGEEPKPTGASFTYGVDYGFEPSVGVVAGKCASCDVMFRGETHSELNWRLRQHAEACQKRPLEVGDLVRFDLHKGDSWLEGHVTTLCTPVYGYAQIVPVGSSPDLRCYVEQGSFTFQLDSKNYRRIPRPVAEVKAETSGLLLRCQGLNSGRQCDETVRGHVGGWRCPTHDACTTYHGGGDWCMFCGRGPSIHRVDPAAAPSQVTVTYDGLTAEECLERFITWQRGEPVNGVSHRTREGGNRPLLPAQLTAARELWSMQLRQRVEAAKDRDRLQVVIGHDVEDDKWR